MALALQHPRAALRRAAPDYPEAAAPRRRGPRARPNHPAASAACAGRGAGAPALGASRSPTR